MCNSSAMSDAFTLHFPKSSFVHQQLTTDSLRQKGGQNRDRLPKTIVATFKFVEPSIYCTVIGRRFTVQCNSTFTQYSVASRVKLHVIGLLQTVKSNAMGLRCSSCYACIATGRQTAAGHVYTLRRVSTVTLPLFRSRIAVAGERPTRSDFNGQTATADFLTFRFKWKGIFLWIFLCNNGI